jgi:hypothetical protein
VRLKSAAAAAPVPISVEVCVPTESAAESVALSVPAIEALNVTLIVQEAPAASEVPQVFAAMAKSDEFVPTRPMDVIGSAAVPELDSVKALAALTAPTGSLPKFAVDGLNAAFAAGGADPTLLSVLI